MYVIEMQLIKNLLFRILKKKYVLVNKEFENYLTYN